ncbi:MAG: hypothetical protein HOC88_16075 [Rhodospirillaceae bacterium]|nr:hypothetical protein [Rhodospirillaceae bacterium]
METNTDIYLPPLCIVLDVWIGVNVIDASATVDVGTTLVSNDPDGYLDAAALGVAGLVKGIMTDSAVTKGVLLTEDEDGSGALVPLPDFASSSDRISFTTSSGCDTADFDIYVMYLEM